MWSSVAHILLVLSTVAANTVQLQKRADDGVFTSPGGPGSVDYSQNPEWQMKFVQDVKWEWSTTTRYTVFNMYVEHLFVNVKGSNWTQSLLIYEKIAENPDPGQFEWPVTPGNIDFDLLDDKVFRLSIKANNTSNRQFYSGPFNITHAATSPKTSLAAAPVTSPATSLAPSPATSSASSVVATVTETVTGTPTAQDGDSRTLALGLGLGLGFPLLFLLGAFIGLFFSTLR